MCARAITGTSRDDDSRLRSKRRGVVEGEATTLQTRKGIYYSYKSPKLGRLRVNILMKEGSLNKVYFY